MGAQVPRRVLIPVLVVVVALVAATALLLSRGPETKSVTVHLDRAVSIFPGSEVRILGVRIGEVTAVVPEGDTVRVELSYDAEYRIPADAQAVVITPTLLSDRFIQLTPVYTGGKVMADGADIPRDQTGTPVELDRIYASLSMLSNALGPNGANQDGSLNTLLRSGAQALDGEGARFNQTIQDLADAAQTFGNSSGDLFATVEHLDDFTRALASSDRVVDRFMSDLARASGQLSGERQELSAALVALAGAVDEVRQFVKTNRADVVGEVRDLTEVLDVLVKEQDSLTTAIEKGPLGAGNLALGFDILTGSQNARIQVGPNVEDLDGFLCAVVTNAQVPQASAACQLFEALLEPLGLQLPRAQAGDAPDPRLPGEAKPAGSLQELLGRSS